MPSVREITLPPPPAPSGAYVPAVAHGGVVYTAGVTPRQDGWLICVGRVGVDVRPEQARAAAGLAALRALSAAAAEVGGVERITRLLRLTVYVACAPDFAGHTAVGDGASEALLAVLGPPGTVARTTCGVSSLPGGACVEVELVAAYKERAS